MTTPKYGSWQTPSPRPNMTTTVTPFDTKGPKRLWSAPAGWVLRTRGSLLPRNTFVCPVHGAFEARSDADVEVCPVECVVDNNIALRHACSRDSPWSPSPFSAWQSSGMVRG